MALSWAIET